MDLRPKPMQHWMLLDAVLAGEIRSAPARMLIREAGWRLLELGVQPRSARSLLWMAVLSIVEGGKRSRREMDPIRRLLIRYGIATPAGDGDVVDFRYRGPWSVKWDRLAELALGNKGDADG